MNSGRNPNNVNFGSNFNEGKNIIAKYGTWKKPFSGITQKTVESKLPKGCCTLKKKNASLCNYCSRNNIPRMNVGSYI
jgi:hypothetical protein